MENSVGGEKINGIRVKSLMRVLLLIFLAACRASEIVLGTVSSLKVKVTIAKNTDVCVYNQPKVSIQGRRLHYNEGELQITGDLEVKEIVALDDGQFQLNVDGNPNSIEVIDSDRLLVEKIKQEVWMKIQEVKLGSPSLPAADEERGGRRRSSRRLSVGSPFLSAQNNNSKSPSPVRSAAADIQVQRGLVRTISQKMTTVSERMESKQQQEGEDDVRHAENFRDKLAAFNRSPNGKKPALSLSSSDSNARSKRSSWKRPAGDSIPAIPEISSTRISSNSSSPAERRTRIARRSSLPSPGREKPAVHVPEDYDPKVRTKIATFSPTKRSALKRAESEPEAGEEKPKTLPRRNLRELQWLKEKRAFQRSQDLHGIGADEMAARREQFKRKSPEKISQDGKRGISRRNSSIFQENKRSLPKRSLSGQEEEESWTESGRDEESWLSQTCEEENEDVDGASMYDIRLQLPQETSVIEYYNMFRSTNPVPASILNAVGRHYRVTPSLLERLVHVKRSKHALFESSVGQSEESSTMSFVTGKDRLQKFQWTGLDTAGLIEWFYNSQKSKGASTHVRAMFQIFQSGRFADVNDGKADRIYQCLPEAIGYHLATATAVPKWAPAKYNSDGSSLVLRSPLEHDNLLDHLVDWADHEMALPTWSALSASFEDGSILDYSLSFSIGLHLAEDLILAYHDQIVSFLRIQYKKAILDAIYTGQDVLVLALPPRFNLADAAEKAIGLAVEDLDFYLPRSLIIHAPSSS